MSDGTDPRHFDLARRPSAAELRARLVERDNQLEAANAKIAALTERAERAEKLYEAAWAECEAWRAYEIEACDHACDPPVSVVNAHDTARREAGRGE